MSSERRPLRLVLVLAAALAASAAVAVLLVLGRREIPGGKGSGNGGAHPLPAAPGAERELLRRLPGGVRFLIVTDDLGRLAAELREGPAGRLARTPSFAKFAAALREEPPAFAAEVFAALDLALEIEPLCSGPAALVLWQVAPDLPPALGFLARLGGGPPARAVEVLSGHLAAPGAKPREVPGTPGQALLTLAPERGEGRSWGSAAGWVAAADSLAGCRELLGLAAGPRAAAPEEVGAALAAAGPGRISGYFAASALTGTRLAAAAGFERVDWAGCSGSPAAGGGWAERLVVSGKRSADGGVFAGLDAGAPRPLLAALPAGTLLAASLGVRDGGKLWGGVLAALEGTEAGALAAHGAELAGRLAGGKDFARELAPRFRGELTAAWTLPSQGLFPQALLGAGLERGADETLAPLAEQVLQTRFFGGGEVSSAEYRGARLCWLSGQSAPNPFAPSPGYCFTADRLLASGSSVHLKELLAGRGQRWLSAAESQRMTAAALGLRISLRNSMPFLVGEARRLGLTDCLGGRAPASLPSDEDLADHLDFLELTAGTGPEGLILGVRSPLPAVPAVALALLLAE